VRRKRFEGLANLAAMGKAMNERYDRISAEAMIASMGGF